jgi:putative glutamine amidotransferase
MKKRLLSLIIMLVLIFGSMPLTVSAESKITRKPHLLMVDNSRENKRVVKEFKRVGVRVTTVYRLSKVDPEKYDGLIVPGGHNIDPRMYHAKRSRYTYGTNIKKDRLQVKAVRRFAAAGKPVLGLCRGCQVINVAFGGTIKQHISWHKGYRRVKNVKGYWMYRLYGSGKNTYHFHHQCVKKLGDGLVATSYDVKSKHIESIQHKTLPVYGVQWHPDCDIKKQGNKLFREFKKICLKNMANRTQSK